MKTIRTILAFCMAIIMVAGVFAPVQADTIITGSALETDSQGGWAFSVNSQDLCGTDLAYLNSITYLVTNYNHEIIHSSYWAVLRSNVVYGHGLVEYGVFGRDNGYSHFVQINEPFDVFIFDIWNTSWTYEDAMMEVNIDYSCTIPTEETTTTYTSAVLSFPNGQVNLDRQLSYGDVSIVVALLGIIGCIVLYMFMRVPRLWRRSA